MSGERRESAVAAEVDAAVPDLLQAAVATHTLFALYVEAGFTEDQAIKMTAALATASGTHGPVKEG